MWRNVFWVAAIGLIVAYLFFWMLGAFHVSDAWWLTGLVIVLAVAWILESLRHRGRPEDRDPRLTHARERRGF